MARMGHDSERAALIYQHQARGADRRITAAIDLHVQAERDQGADDNGAAGAAYPLANGTLMARKLNCGFPVSRPGQTTGSLTCGFALERVTGGTDYAYRCC